MWSLFHVITEPASQMTAYLKPGRKSNLGGIAGAGTEGKVPERKVFVMDS